MTRSGTFSQGPVDEQWAQAVYDFARNAPAQLEQPSIDTVWLGDIAVQDDAGQVWHLDGVKLWDLRFEFDASYPKRTWRKRLTDWLRGDIIRLHLMCAGCGHPLRPVLESYHQECSGCGRRITDHYVAWACAQFWVKPRYAIWRLLREFYL